MAENRRLAAARVLKGLTQRQLAEAVGAREIESSRMAEVLQKPAMEIFAC